MAVRDVYLWANLFQRWEYSESRDRDNSGGEDVNKANKYLFSNGSKRRSLVVEYELVTKLEANVTQSAAGLGTMRGKKVGASELMLDSHYNNNNNKKKKK